MLLSWHIDCRLPLLKFTSCINQGTVVDTKILFGIDWISVENMFQDTYFMMIFGCLGKKIIFSDQPQECVDGGKLYLQIVRKVALETLLALLMLIY